MGGRKNYLIFCLNQVILCLNRVILCLNRVILSKKRLILWVSWVDRPQNQAISWENWASRQLIQGRPTAFLLTL